MMKGEPKQKPLEKSNLSKATFEKSNPEKKMFGQRNVTAGHKKRKMVMGSHVQTNTIIEDKQMTMRCHQLAMIKRVTKTKMQERP